jgi:hypothetical protein
MNPSEKQQKMALLKAIDPEDRVLLLPHCLRRSEHCQATYERGLGLQCKKCDLDCPVNRILQVAEASEIGGICVAPGGSIAVEYLKKHKPRGILAVACPKELVMGVESVGSMSDNGWDPVVVAIDLLRDGCVDTEVDVELVKEFVNLSE